MTAPAPMFGAGMDFSEFSMWFLVATTILFGFASLLNWGWRRYHEE